MSETQALETRYAPNLYPKRDVNIVSGKGAVLVDDAGREYLDCAAGVGVANVGHSHPTVVAAVQKQAAELMVCPNVFYHPQRAALLEKLVSLAPEKLTRAFLCNSGAESVEAALKFARLARPGRSKIVTAMRGFHGRTMGAVSATFTKKYRQPFEPLVPGFHYVPLNKIDKLDAALDDNTAALMIELVQGEGGVNLADVEYVAAARRLCDERGVLLIIDEIQTGFGRTGAMFACEHFDLQPDMMTLAKAIAGGVPMGATLISDEITIEPGHHGTTFGGNPLACAAALATIDVLQTEGLPAQAEARGEYFAQRLAQHDVPQLREVRRRGLMIGLELKVKVQPVLQALMQQGVLALPAGATVLRLLPPLCISEAQIDQLIERLVPLLQRQDQ